MNVKTIIYYNNNLMQLYNLPKNEYITGIYIFPEKIEIDFYGKNTETLYYQKNTMISISRSKI